MTDLSAGICIDERIDKWLSEIAVLYAQCYLYRPPGDSERIKKLASADNVCGLVCYDGLLLSGFVLFLCSADQAEIIEICVAPDKRSRGIATALLSAAENSLSERRIARLFLDVAEDNSTALSLYRNCGFDIVGRRKNYYIHPEGRKDALVMKKSLPDRTQEHKSSPA